MCQRNLLLLRFPTLLILMVISSLLLTINEPSLRANYLKLITKRKTSNFSLKIIVFHFFRQLGLKTHFTKISIWNKIKKTVSQVFSKLNLHLQYLFGEFMTLARSVHKSKTQANLQIFYATAQINISNYLLAYINRIELLSNFYSLTMQTFIPCSPNKKDPLEKY